MTKTITITTTNTNCNENNFNIIENLNNRRLILCVSFFHYNHYNCVRSTATFLCQETLSVKRRPHLVPPLTRIFQIQFFILSQLLIFIVRSSSFTGLPADGSQRSSINIERLHRRPWSESLHLYDGAIGDLE